MAWPPGGRRPTCRSFSADLSALVDQALDLRRREEVLRHLAGCPDCRAEAGALRRVRDTLIASRQPTPVPGNLETRLVGIAGEYSSQPLWVDRAGGPARLPSVRDRTRSGIRMLGAGVAVLGVTAAVGGWMVAPQLNLIRDPQRAALREFSASVPNTAVSQALSAVLLAKEKDADLEAPVSVPGRGDLGAGLPIPGAQARQMLATASRARVPYGGVLRVSAAVGDGYVATDARVREEPGTGVQTTVFDVDGDEVIQGYVPATGRLRAVLGASDPVSSFTLVPGHRLVAGVNALLLESFGPNGELTHRWWINPQLGLLLWSETYDPVGRVLHSAGFIHLDVLDAPQGTVATTQLVSSQAGTPVDRSASLCRNWACPATLAGLPLVSISTDSGALPSMLHSVYSDGAVTISVVQQAGRLAPGGPPADRFASGGSPAVAAWQSGKAVVTVAGDAPAALFDLACAELPHQGPADDGVLARIWSGLEHMAGRS